MITKKYKAPLYNTKFTVIIYSEHKEIEAYFKKMDFEVPDNCDAWVYEIKGMIYCVFYALEKGYPTPGIIAHESKHLVNNIFIRIGHKLSRWNDEPEAYLLGWIVDRIHELKDSKKC